MTRSATLLLLLAYATAAGAADGGASRSARELNADGSALAKAGDLQGAVARFRDAFTAEPRLAIAHYNFASTVFGALQADGCSDIASLDEALDHLTLSIQLDPTRLDRLKVDPEFEGFRHSAGYFALLGEDVHSVKGIGALLPKLNMQAPTRADSGPFFKLQFHERGKVDIVDHDLTQTGWTWVKRPGTWKLKSVTTDGGAQAVVLELDAAAAGSLPAIHYSGRVRVGKSGLVLEEPDSWPYFASDRWSDCCC